MTEVSAKSLGILFVKSIKMGCIYYLKKMIPFVSYVTFFTFFFFPDFLKEVLTSPLARWNWVVMWSQLLIVPVVIYTIYKVLADKKSNSLNVKLV